MKAIDSWVFVCMLFVFSSLAEYGLILHLTSRSVWQKRVDQHIKSITGASRLSVLSTAKLISMTINKDTPEDQNRFHYGKFISKLAVEVSSIVINFRRKVRCLVNTF